MLSTLFSRNRRDPRSAAEDLMTRLDEESSLLVDDALVAAMGVGRKALYRIIYEMVRRERMFMLADTDDRMLLMTNTEFNRFLFRRAGRATEFPMLTMEAPSCMGDISDSDVVLCDTEDSDLVLEGPAARMTEDSWFTLDIAPDVSAAVGMELPDHRQSLPERKREPWPLFEEMEQG